MIKLDGNIVFVRYGGLFCFESVYLLDLPLPYNLCNQEHVDTFGLLQCRDRQCIRDRSPLFHYIFCSSRNYDNCLSFLIISAITLSMLYSSDELYIVTYCIIFHTNM